MQIIIQSQYSENYGAHDWDGTGECPQYWKMKGGSEYRARISVAQVLAMGGKALAAHVDSLIAKHVTKSDNYCQEWALDWFLLDDCALTPEQEFFRDDTYKPEPIEIA